MSQEYRTVFGVQGNEVIPLEAVPVEGGWIVKQGCFRHFVEAEKLSTTREGAEERLRRLNGEQP